MTDGTETLLLRNALQDAQSLYRKTPEPKKSLKDALPARHTPTQTLLEALFSEAAPPVCDLADVPFDGSTRNFLAAFAGHLALAVLAPAPESADTLAAEAEAAEADGDLLRAIAQWLRLAARLLGMQAIDVPRLEAALQGFRRCHHAL